MIIANTMVDDQPEDGVKRPAWTLIEEVKEREEPVLFKVSEWQKEDA